MATLKEAFAWNLARLLEERRENQTDLTRALGVSFPTVNAAVNGRGGVSEKLVRACAKHFGVEESELVRPKPKTRNDYFEDIVDQINQCSEDELLLIHSTLTAIAIAREKRALQARDQLGKPRKKRQ